MYSIRSQELHVVDDLMDDCSDNELLNTRLGNSRENELSNSSLCVGMQISRTKSLYSLASNVSPVSSASSVYSAEPLVPIGRPIRLDAFGRDMRLHTNNNPHSPAFDSSTRKIMEPYLRRARLLRESSRLQPQLQVHASIASSVGVPYTSLRRERAFLFDEYSFPLNRILCETLGVNDLTTVHQISNDDHELLAPLLDRARRRSFHEAYDNFVTSFCIPLIHSIAMSHDIFHFQSASERICYRYQAFPNINILRPDGTANAPTCDTIKGHSIGCLRFHIPLTPSQGTSALYVESHPGREDWHPLATKSFGLGYLYDGARCLYFDLENTTGATRVSLDFCIMIYTERPDYEVDNSGLCSRQLIADKFSEGCFYDDAFVDLGGFGGMQIALKRRWTLPDPDPRVGTPF